MKTQKLNSLSLRITLGALSLLFCPLSFADIAQKKPLKINFNEMIEKSSHERAQLEHKMGDHFQDDEIADAQEDTRKVIDFVDVEVQWGDSPQVVDRRFNSMGSEKLDEVHAPNVEVPRAPQSTSAQRIENKVALPN